ncbi:hypothetical protein [Clostridium sp.]|uniref:hypothetical protein n=1 Tax=Clostridium sp. TaxID=1506 RepID=UPI00283B5A41|nr:hypothetical protein [Clostridium sp.]MDR3598521.1 hypothetical protein [Clostridium sp.]
MKNGDICLKKGTGIISEAIEEFENSQYSHATTFIDGQLIEAEGFEKTEYIPIDKYKGQLDVFNCNSLTDEQRQGIKDFLSKQVGTRYDYLLLIIEAIRYALHVTLPYKEPFHRHICSTLVVDAYKSVGMDLCPGIKYPSPKDISESKLLRKVSTL